MLFSRDVLYLFVRLNLILVFTFYVLGFTKYGCLPDSSFLGPKLDLDQVGLPTIKAVGVTYICHDLRVT